MCGCVGGSGGAWSWLVAVGGDDMLRFGVRPSSRQRGPRRSDEIVQVIRSRHCPAAKRSSVYIPTLQPRHIYHPLYSPLSCSLPSLTYTNPLDAIFTPHITNQINMFRSTIARVSRPMATRGYADKCERLVLFYLVVLPYLIADSHRSDRVHSRLRDRR